MSDPSASSTAGRPPGAPAHRHRDRHGRGIRGPLAPPQVPLAASRAEMFDGLVLDSADRLRRRLPQLGRVDFEVHEVPEPGSDEEPVPLGRAVPEDGDRPARIVVYRRPVELRARGRDDRAALVHEVVVEQAAELLGLAPETIDPRYGQD
ncbi:metallopeptidase family protein [Streptomyces spiramenti]|uniref:Metallopeptidase family protein n=1 Tax=Streptomyces spiramenti TaxID=2720606 RepID=A0ABX1APB8_9ACTN|nr:metallopeptidase family protein [Streptomyces spiramenti]NJP68919.1 metallopeptidase family protein [Streptomyces spiramenti]